MEYNELKQLLEKIRGVKIAVYGDFCLDAYWILNPQGGEISVETGLQTQAVEHHYYTPGGASNIAANLAALKPGQIRAIGAIGDDIFGRELVRVLNSLNVETSSLTVQTEQFSTVTFSKRYLQGKEQPRIDFGFFNQRSKPTDDRLLADIETALQQCDAVIFNQQVPGSLSRSEFIDGANALFKKYYDKIVVLDSRHYSERFGGVCRKMNDIEACRLNGVQAETDAVISLSDLKKYAAWLYEQSGKPVFITRGARGILIADGSGISVSPGIQILKKIDTVGAGDTTISALAAALATGATAVAAADFANLAAAVTIQKLFQTGAADAQEILQVNESADYIYQPELAEDIRQARYVAGTDIEICCDDALTKGRIRHALFDHDGTISTLRQGWEQVMEPVMVKAILGDAYDDADETLYHRVLHRVREYIDQSTGIQTIQQMESLVEIVKEFGIVPSDQVLDKQVYKQMFHHTLMERVNRRIEKYQKGQLGLDDFTVKGSVAFLESLCERGVTCYLASGTDHEDVVREANVLGYGRLFAGGMYGSVGDVNNDSKKMVIEKIMNEHHLEGPELAVFGDGPVEIRQCRRRHGIAVGVASDEIRRWDLNPDKRARLIKAGAHLIVSDFSQQQQLLEQIGL